MIPLCTELGLGPGDSVRMGPTSPKERGTAAPHFSAHVYCGQTAGWIRIPLRTEVRLGPGHIVRWGPSSALHTKGSAAPTFPPTALAHIPAGPHFTHNPYCRLGSVRRAAVVEILQIITTRLVYN